LLVLEIDIRYSDVPCGTLVCDLRSADRAIIMQHSGADSNCQIVAPVSETSQILCYTLLHLGIGRPSLIFLYSHTASGGWVLCVDCRGL